MSEVPLWVTIVASLGGSAAVTGLFVLVQKLLEIRAARNASQSERSHADGREESGWNANYRNVAVIATNYMNNQRNMIFDLRRQVDELRKASGLEPHVWPEMEESPNLFPPPPPQR